MTKKKRPEEQEEARQDVLQEVMDNPNLRSAAFFTHEIVFKGLKETRRTEEGLLECLDDLAEGLPALFGRCAGRLMAEQAKIMRELQDINKFLTLIHRTQGEEN